MVWTVQTAVTSPLALHTMITWYISHKNFLIVNFLTIKASIIFYCKNVKFEILVEIPIFSENRFLQNTCICFDQFSPNWQPTYNLGHYICTDSSIQWSGGLVRQQDKHSWNGWEAELRLFVLICAFCYL